MPRSLDRPRLVLASLVPVETRADPLDYASLTRTDFGGISALLLTKPNRDLDSRLCHSNNQHHDELCRLDEQLAATKRAWTQQQERSFDTQIALTASQDPGQQTRLDRTKSPSPMPSLEISLRVVEDLIRDAGDALADTTLNGATLGSARDLYAKAAAHLAETLRTLQPPR